MRKHLLTVLLTIFLQPFLVFSQSTLHKVESLKLQKKEGIITQYYSSGCAQQAAALEELLKKSLSYFEERLGLKEQFLITVLNKNDWSEITDIPFGLPFVSGPPYIICFPSNTNNTLAQLIKKSIQDYNLTNVYSSSEEELVQLFISLIGFHEMGHIYAKEYGFKFPNKWTFEFTATYFAYLYLSDNFKTESEIWYKISEILSREINPLYTGISDFENLYFRVGIESYTWYQVVFLLKAASVCEKLDIEFIKKLSAANLTSSAKYYSLDVLEKIDPGFINWAEAFKLIE